MHDLPHPLQVAERRLVFGQQRAFFGALFDTRDSRQQLADDLNNWLERCGAAVKAATLEDHKSVPHRPPHRLLHRAALARPRFSGEQQQRRPIAAADIALPS